MKKALKVLIIAIAAVASYSCEQSIENNTLDIQKNGFKLIADVDSEITKTVLSGTSILWGESDAVKAYGDNVYTSTGITRSNGDKTAEFTFGPLADGDAVLRALYPATNAGGTDYGNMEITIPTEQAATKGSFDPAAMAAIGAIDGDYKIAFKNIGALLSIVINNDDIKSVELSASEANSESMTGTAAVELNDEGVITTLTDGSSTSVKLTGGLENGETYYFVVYPGTYSNLRIVVTRNDDAIAVYRNKTPFTVERNTNWSIADLTIPDGKWVPSTVSTRYFYESFGKCEGTGGNDDSWNGSIATTATTSSDFDNSGWSSSNSYAAKECVKLGTGSAAGSITTPALSTIPTGKNLTLKFKAGAWDASKDGTTLNLSVEGTGSVSPTSVTMEKGAFKTFVVSLSGLNTSSKVTFTAANYRFFLDEVEVLGEEARSDVANHYTVSYDANGATAGTEPSDATDYNDQTNFIVTVLGAGTLAKTGFNFTGWNTAADGSGTSYAPGATFVISNNVTLYAQWEAIMYTITKNVNSHGTYTVKAGDVEVTEAAYGTVLTLTANTPDPGYSFSKFTVNYTDAGTPKTSNFTVNPKNYNMPNSDIEITLVLSEVTTYDVTLMYNGSEHSVVPVSEGASILDAISSVGSTLTPPTGKSFLGWSTSSDPESVSLITDSNLATANITLYAVFGAAAKYQLVESDLGSANWAGDYLIAYSDAIFMDGSLPGGTSDGTVGYKESTVSPGSALSADKKTVTAAWGDLHYLTLEAVTDGYVLKTHSATTPYIYRSSNNNGIDATANQSTAANYKITITFTSSHDVKLAVSSGPTLRYNANTVASGGTVFRFYKNAGQSAIYLYKKQLGETIITW